VNCYDCERPATNACKRCAHPYCEDHGNAAYCSACLQPASALPSFNLYRGALLAMLVGTALAVFLILRPPGESGDAAPVVVNNARATPTPSVATDATVPAETPISTQTAGTPPQDATPPVTATSASASATPEITPTQSPFGEYTVQEGDTLYDIAAARIAPGDNLDAFARAIAALNGIDFDNPSLPVGKTILLPKPPQ
jgi:hypothetical protein